MQLPSLSLIQWLLVIFCAFLIGFSKTGFNLSMLMVPIMAAIFGGKVSSGVVLPMLVFGDFIAVGKYNRHADWRYIKKLLPWAFAGIVLGLVVGNLINDLQFKQVIAVIVIVGLLIMIGQERRGENAPVPHQWWFSALLGLAGGFSTMIGNAAGPVMGIYLLAMQLPKYEFIGTGAWFFIIVNLVKLPLQALFWKGITPSTLVLDALMIPAILIGTWLGIIVIRRVPEKPFRIAVIVLTAVAAVRLIFS